MAIPPISDPLAARLSNLPGRLFAVLDGAAFDDVQGVLTKAGLDFRPLYLDEAKESGTLAAGPHLVPCPTNFHIEQLREACGDEGIVWWAWPKGAGAGDEIFRHLRGIGMVEIPADRPDIPEDRQPAAADKENAEYEAVLIRHADPAVMAGLLPILTIPQRSRLFGMAHALVMDRPGAEPLYAPRSAEFTKPDNGLLRITLRQYSEIATQLLSDDRRAVMDFLREAVPEDVGPLGDRDLYGLVVKAEEDAHRIGLSSELGHLYWAFLFATFGPGSHQLETFRDETTRAADPDDHVIDLVDRLSSLTDAQAEAFA